MTIKQSPRAATTHSYAKDPDDGTAIPGAACRLLLLLGPLGLPHPLAELELLELGPLPVGGVVVICRAGPLKGEVVDPQGLEGDNGRNGNSSPPPLAGC
jgi:hypothetical protein